MKQGEYKEGAKCLVDVYDYKKREVVQIKGTIKNIVTALDCPFRVNVETEDGRIFNECHPECIHP